MPIPEQIESRVSDFKADLIALTPERVVRKFLTTGEPYIMDDSAYFRLKEEIARKFSIESHHVLMVGSGKLGFSIKPNNEFRPFSQEISDIDIAIIDSAIFEEFWRNVFLYKKSGGWWNNEEPFKKYLFQGWIRPDMLPTSTGFPQAQDWWDFFREIGSRGEYGPYKIKAGLYHSMFFLEKYQSICTTRCKEMGVGV